MHEIEVLINRLREQGKTLVLAESCTAGLVADLMGRIPGVSNVLWGSFVCYTAQAKCVMLDLDPVRLQKYGLVSRETACDMARSALVKSGASLAAAVTGIAGPDSDESGLAAGTVWIATALRVAAPQKPVAAAPQKPVAATPGLTVDALAAQPLARLYQFSGSRNEVREQAARALVRDLLKALDKCV